ncbi:MAG: response regulator transcription factor [Planctomycetota bacterium]|nr:response regulator transcription factor [Planctomycetota bacterium]MCB9900822.1 response regulator transcription factor [Planctomycetota bacterium]
MKGDAPAPRVLVVEDESTLAAGIAENLEAEGYVAEVVGDGAKALERIRAREHDLVLLDVMLPRLDGYTVCRKAREEGIGVPVLFLTARAEEADRITGLESGGDDYLGKPFSLRELLLRVAAILKRYRWYEGPDSTGTLLRFGGNEVDFRTYVGTAWDGRRHELTHKEAMILKLLTECEGEVVSRERVLDVVWGYEVYPSTRTIDNFILRLRKRFERDSDAPLHFHTVRGVGYRFTKDPGFTP